MRFLRALGLVVVGLACLSFASRCMAQQAENPFGDSTQVVKSTAAPAADDPFGDAAEAKPPKPGQKSTQSTRRVPANRNELKQTLFEPTKMQFVDLPLQDVIAFLQDFHGILIQFDIRALENAGVGADTPITLDVSNVSLRTGLDLILDQYDLAYVLRDNILLITTKDAAENGYQEMEVYDLSPLVSDGAKPEEIVALLRSLNLPAAWPAHGGEQAKSSVGLAAPFRNLLVIRASQREHEEIGKLLSDMQTRLEKRGE